MTRNAGPSASLAKEDAAGGLQALGDRRHEWWSDARHGGLAEYWMIFRRRLGALAVYASLGAIAGLLISLAQTPFYRAQSLVEIQGLNGEFLNIKDVNPTIAADAGFTRSDTASQIQLLQSRSLIENVTERLKRKEPTTAPPTGSRWAVWRASMGFSGHDAFSPWREALLTAARNFQATAHGDTRIVEIVTESSDPRVAADFVNTLTERFIEQNIEARWQDSQRTEEWLGRQLGGLRGRLEKSEQKLQHYARDSGLMFDSQYQNVAEERLRQLQGELSRAQADRISRQSRYQLTHSRTADSLPGSANDAPLASHRLKLTDLRRQLAELSASFTPAHYKVKRIQAQIGELEAAIRKEQEHLAQRMKDDYEAAVERENLLAENYSRQAKLVSDLAAKSIQYDILKREVETNRQLYDSLLQKVKEAGMASALSASNIRVIDRASVPEQPFRPNRALNAAMGLLCGLFAGAVMIFARERADCTVKQPGDISCQLDLPELGVIPAAGVNSISPPPRKRKVLRVRIKFGRHDGPLLRRRRLATPYGANRLELVTWARKPCAMADSFRATLTSILLAGQNGSRPRVLIVTSPAPGEGKTTVASNLAIALAEIDRRVLVIDADIRHPRLHGVFGAPNDWGLSSLLQQQRPVSGYGLRSIARDTEIPGLSLLPSGPPAPAVSNLFHSNRAKELLAWARSEFDTVLIDTPPMIQIPDARTLGPMADAVVLVLRAGHTTRDAARAAAERLLEDGTKLLGAVLNGWDPKLGGLELYGYGLDGYGSDAASAAPHGPQTGNKEALSLDPVGPRPSEP